MSKNILALIVGVFIISLSIYIVAYPANNKNEEEEITEKESVENVNKELIDCLADEGVVIYGSITCPACGKLADSFGGYEVMEPIYVECSYSGTEEEKEACDENKKTGYVPEVQINKEVFDLDFTLFNEGKSPEELAKKVGCELL